MSQARRPSRTSRRAGVLVAALLALAWINLVVIGAVTSAGDDARLGAWRVQAIHAHAAAESAARIALRLQKDDPETPATGFIELPGGVAVTIVDAFEASPEAPGELRVEASVGEAKQQCVRVLTEQP